MADAIRLVLVVALVGLAAATVRAEDEVRLVSGDVLRGRIVEITDKELILEHVDLGRITIPIDRIRTHSKIESEPVEAEEEEPSPLEEEIDAVLKEQEKKKKTRWKFSSTIGGSFTNDDEGSKLKFNLRSTASRRDALHDTVFRTSWIYSTNNRETDENTFNITGSHARRYEDMRLFWWIKSRYDYDDFRDWRQRITMHVGPGYDLIRKKKFDFALLLGIGGRKEFGSTDESLKGEFAGGFHLGWRPRERHTITFGITSYPGINDNNERVITTVDWSVLLDRKIGMSFNTHLNWEYDSTPDSGFPPNTIRWTWGFQFDF